MSEAFLEENMASLASIDRDLEDHYALLAARRNASPVYAVEHGLSSSQIRNLALAMADRVVHHGIERADGRFIHIALASEVGYTYEGMMSGYWPHMETLLGSLLAAADRETLSALFLEAHETIGIARPDETRFSRRFRHIAWPLVNALAPRQLHAGLSKVLLDAARLDPGDSAFTGLVRQGCLRSGEPRLIEWSENAERIDAVVSALLGTPDGRLSVDITDRLAKDAIAAPLVRERIVQARSVRKSGRGALRRNLPEAPPNNAEKQTAGFSRVGGIAVDFRRFATGVPIGICADTTAVCATLFERDASPLRQSIEPGGCAVFAPASPAQLTLNYSDATGEPRSVTLDFDDVPPAPTVIDVTLQPEEARLSDLRDGHLSIVFGGEAAHGLRDVPVTLVMSVPGWPLVVATDMLPRLPGRLTGDNAALRRLAEALDNMEEASQRPRSARLDIECGVCRSTQWFLEPEPEVRWFEAEGEWNAVPDGEDEGSELEDSPLRVLSVRADDPLATPVERHGETGGLLLRAEGFSATSAIVTAPTRRRGLAGVPPPEPLAHRRFFRSREAVGLEAELEAWLGWSCARPVHTLAAMEARAAARCAGRAAVSTICGADWLAEKDASDHSGFADLLAARAIATDAVGANLVRKAGTALGENDLATLRRKLAGSFTAFCPMEFAEPEAAHLSDSTAEKLDEAISEAWAEVLHGRASSLYDDIAPDVYNDATRWRELWGDALGRLERRGLSVLVLPRRLAEELRELSYTVVAPVEVARTLGAYRRDLGLMARQGRSLSSDDMLSSLLLWTYPAAFARLDWRPLAKRLLEDRMTSRAVHYAALRLMDVS